MATVPNPCGMPDEQYATLTVEEKRQCQIQAEQAQQMRQQPQGGGMSPGMAMNFIPESGGAAGGEAAAGGGEAGGAMAGMAAPAALAAAIIANETYQNKSGNRPEDFGDHMTELATGEVLERDIERYLGDSKVAKHLGRMGNPKGLAKNMKQSLKPWEWFF
jgi:hypothetical protein